MIISKKTIMKKLLFLLLIIFITVTSCRKDDEYMPWTNVPEELNDTTQWQDNYTDGGTLPYDTAYKSGIVGTKWVLTKMVTSFATEYPNDTIEFLTQNTYIIYGSSIPRNYQLNSIIGSTDYSLSLYYFTSFGGGHYSANVGYYFISDGVIDNAEFHNNYNSTTNKIRTWFKKL